MVADKIVNAFIKILAADAQTAEFGSVRDCSLARALNRRLKKIYRADVAHSFFDIDLVSGGCVCQDLKIDHSIWNEKQFKRMRDGQRGDMILKVQIPAKYLKRIHKPRVKVVAPVAPAPIPQIDKVRKAADILDKVYPNWKDVSLVGCCMSSVNDCFLMRIGKFHNDNRAYYELHDTLMFHGYADDANCFRSTTTVEMWQQVIAERKAAEEAAKPKFDRPLRADLMRQAAKVLDKIFPKWREVSLDNLDMLSAEDCILVRIARLHYMDKIMWTGLNMFLQNFHDCPAVFNCSTTPHDWAIIIAEGKQE